MSRPIVRQGIRLDPVPVGKLPGRRKFNEVQAISEALANSHIKFAAPTQFLLTSRNAVFQINPSDITSAATDASLLKPFQVYNVSGDTYAIHVGSIKLPDLFPSDTTPRHISIEEAYDEQQVNSGTADDDFTFTVAPGANYNIWAEFYTPADPPGYGYLVSPQAIENLSQTMPQATWRISNDATSMTFFLPIATLDSDGTITQYQETLVGGIQFGMGRYRGAYSDIQVYFPGDIVRATGMSGTKQYLQTGDNGSLAGTGFLDAYIGVDPTLEDGWIALT